MDETIKMADREKVHTISWTGFCQSSMRVFLEHIAMNMNAAKNYSGFKFTAVKSKFLTTKWEER